MAFKVCEEYANSGIDILNDFMKKPSEFTLNLIEELLNKQPCKNYGRPDLQKGKKKNNVAYKVV